MTTWWLAFAALFCLAAAGVLLPLLAKPASRGHSRAEGAQAVLQDKLAQVARDREAGLIGEAEARGAEAEISRALIAAAREAEAERGAVAPGKGGQAGMALVAAVALFGAIGLYQLNGSFRLPDQPFAERPEAVAAATPSLASEHEGGAINDAILSLRARLDAEPDNTEAWHLLARSYSAVGSHPDAAAAYSRLIELVPDAFEYRGDRAEALIRADNGFVGPKALDDLRTVVAQAPEDPRAQYYLAMYDAQNGNYMAAAQGWAGILRRAPPDAPYAVAIREILETLITNEGLDRAAIDIPAKPADPLAVLPDLGPAPSAADVAAAAEMSENEQMEMIRSMVARLESRLAEEPGDIDGWLRLARSRMVLGEPEAGVAALEQALTQNPGDPDLQAALTELRAAVAR